MSRREQYQLQYGAYAGPAQPKMGNFPFFKDGDVKIVITVARKYQLHSSILKANSPLMQRLLDDQFTAKLSKQAIKKGVVVRNKIHAVKNHGEDFIPLDVGLILEPISLDNEGRAIDEEPVGLDLENGILVPPIYAVSPLMIHDCVFKSTLTFIRRPMILSSARSTTAPSTLVGLGRPALQIFSRWHSTSQRSRNTSKSYVNRQLPYQIRLLTPNLMFSQIDMITKPIEAELLSTGQTAQRSIAQDPAAWLDFAYRIRSKAVFREALIHAVGQVNTPPMQTAMRKSMRRDVLELVVKKAKIQCDGVKTALRNVLSYYPLHLQRARMVGLAEIDNFGRDSYSNDIFNWMALTVYRHYVTQYVANDQTHLAPDMGFWLLSAMGEGGDRYLDKATLNEFHRLFPMSNKGMSVVESKVNDIKEEVKKFVVVRFLIQFRRTWRLLKLY